MFRSDALADLVGLLERRRVYLYHACQFQDFCSYLRLGGVPSRAKLEQTRLAVTPFTTDATDRANGVWDKVFVNWEDFGRGFARGHPAVPNPYGPILLRLNPRALLSAVDAAVCLRSAGAEGFDRARESLQEVSDVDRLFYYGIDEGRSPAALKFKDLLRRDFGPLAQSVEVSCTFERELLPLENLIDVVVDPYSVNSIQLAHLVQDAAHSSGYELQVNLRRSAVGEGLYQRLLEAVEERTPSLPELAKHSRNRKLREWAGRVARGSELLRRNFERYAQYLRAGTIGAVGEAGAPPRAPLLIRSIGVAPDRWEEELDFEASYLDDEEQELLFEEHQEYQADWARSNEDGWFYDDEADDEWDGGDDVDDASDEDEDGWDEAGDDDWP